MSYRFRHATLVLPLALACGSAPTEISAARPDDPASTFASQRLAFVNVSVVTMTSPTVLEHQTVVVQDGVIASIGPMAQEQALGNATIVQGHGRVLMPALVDMHVHMLTGDVAKYPAHGIGTVRNMWGHSNVRTIRDEVAAGTRFGPQVITVSSGVDAPPGQWPVTQFVTNADEARTVVGNMKALGYGHLKLYTSLSAAMFDTLVQLAKDNGMQPLGHVPMSVPVAHALAKGMKSIEHYTGYDRAVSATGQGGTFGWANADETRFASLVQQTLAAGTWNCPTLAIYAKLSENQSGAANVVASRRRFTKALHDAGAKLLIGSDAGIEVVAPGASLQDELDQFVAAGLTPYETLRIATVKAAEFFDRTDFGVIAPGARADLLLIARNPLEDVRRVREIGGVVLAGAWTPQRELTTRTSGWKQ
jgi:imidazolonepropionase-like amidohydrolase